MILPTFNKQPVLLRATYHINTPMFVAGENTQEAELTPTAFKGVMRFWWRALNWSKIYLELLEKSENLDKKSALKELHRQEAKLFGLASKNNQGGQGECLVNALQINGDKKWSLPDNKNGINYLLGQGLYNFRTGLTRSALANNQSFTIDLTVTKSAESSIIDVLKLIGLLGSFGSRSRHGFGSVTLTKLEKKGTSSEYQSLQFEQKPITAMNTLLATYRCKENEELPPLSAFYADTRIDIVKLTGKNVIAHLNQLGLEELRYRSYGRNGKIDIGRNNEGRPIKEDAEQIFWEDHHFILNMLNKLNKYGKKEFEDSKLLHPDRVVFGLPHNYFFSGNSTKGCSANVDSSTGRRASPLIRHIYRADNGELKLIHCLLKSEFLPQDAKIKIHAIEKKDKKIQQQSTLESKADIDWSVITDFMNDFEKETI